MTASEMRVVRATQYRKKKKMFNYHGYSVPCLKTSIWTIGARFQ